jgi:hypothetical protein
MEFWKQITFGAGGTGELGAADVVEVVTVTGVSRVDTGVACVAFECELDTGAASSAIAQPAMHSPRAAIVRAVHNLERWGDMCIMVRAYAQG